MRPGLSVEIRGRDPICSQVQDCLLYRMESGKDIVRHHTRLEKILFRTAVNGRDIRPERPIGRRKRSYPDPEIRPESIDVPRPT